MSEPRDSLPKALVKKVFTVFAKIAPIAATKILFRKYIGEKLHLDDPKTLNEKMQYLKLFVHRDHPLITRCTDKYAVREYVKACGLEETLVPLLGVWDKPEDIDFDALPDRFVLKCNHGSGGNIFCTDKASFDREGAVKQLKKWLKTDFGAQRAELIYDHIPRKVIAEAMIETDHGGRPEDYKIFCTYGKPVFLIVATDRASGNPKFDYFTLDYQWYHVKTGPYDNAEVRPEKPQLLSELLKTASVLSEPFPLVRVDLYAEKGKVLFGELTYLDTAGLAPFTPASYDRVFGDLIDTDITQGIMEDRVPHI